MSGGFVAGTWRNNVMAGGPGDHRVVTSSSSTTTSGAQALSAPTPRPVRPAFVDPSHANGNVDLSSSGCLRKGLGGYDHRGRIPRRTCTALLARKDQVSMLEPTRQGR